MTRYLPSLPKYVAALGLNIRTPTRFGPVFIAIVAGALLGCSSGPPDEVVVETVTETLQQRVPVALARHMMGGQNATVRSVRVVKRGKSQKSGSSRYYPIVVHAEGRCYVQLGGGWREFSGDVEYNFSKDAYGDWRAQQAGFAF